MNTLVRNERIKLLATAFNNLGLAFAIGGVVAPLLTAKVSWWSLAWIVAAAALHASAQSVLGRLKA